MLSLYILLEYVEHFYALNNESSVDLELTAANQLQLEGLCPEWGVLLLSE